MFRSGVISLDLGINRVFLTLKGKKTCWMTKYPIHTISLNLNLRQNPRTYMKSSHIAPIIHAFNRAQKGFFQTFVLKQRSGKLSKYICYYYQIDEKVRLIK